jgi:hypothetical protein
MHIQKKADSPRKIRTFSRFFGCLLLVAFGMGVTSGCSSLSLQKPKERQPLTNPWVKPAKEESKPNWFTKMFYKEKPQPKSPSEWLSNPRPE